MKFVRPKKRLGQHFLKDMRIAEEIVSALTITSKDQKILEIGPGTGVLSDLLIPKDLSNLLLLDLDEESIAFLKEKYAGSRAEIQHGDYLKESLTDWAGEGHYSIIGNFPYNISSQIFFKVLDQKDQVAEVVCMLQKEVAQRITSGHGNKVYGILSIFIQAYYDVEYLFTVGAEVFDPPPKVQSAVIRLKRNDVKKLACDEGLFRRVVKQGFQMRRKTLRNALKGLNLSPEVLSLEVMNKRAEQLTIQDFINLTNTIK